MKIVRICIAVLLTGIGTAACADVPTAPDLASVAAAGPSTDVGLEPVIVVAPKPGCDPYLTLNGCQDDGSGTCMTSDPGMGDAEYVGMLGCPGTGGGGGEPIGDGGGSAGPGSGDPTVTNPTYEGPGVFAACVGTLLAVVGTTAAMQPAATSLYDARNAYDSARRMYDAVVANNPSVEMQLLYEHRVEVAKSNYDNAVQTYAGTAGASILAVWR
jgi:hypothetical protein